jgi:hypothetical protein
MAMSRSRKKGNAYFSKGRKHDKVLKAFRHQRSFQNISVDTELVMISDMTIKHLWSYHDYTHTNHCVFQWIGRNSII